MCSTRDCTSWSKQVLCIVSKGETKRESVRGNRKCTVIAYCVLSIVYWVLCIAYCKLGIAFCVLCIGYCDIVSWSECQRKWECIGLASAWYSYQTLLLRNRPTQLLDWLCCFAPLWKQLTFPFSKCFFSGLMDSGSLQWLTRLAMQAPLLVFIRSPPADGTNFLRTNQPPQFP